MDAKVIEAAKKAFPASPKTVTLGAVVLNNESDPEPLVTMPLGMLNRHGLIAGATGTGKTKTLQLIAEQLSNAGVPVFLADVKGDVSGVAVPGETNDRIAQRAKDTGYTWKGAGYPVEFLSLSGARGAQLRAKISSFGPLLLAKVLDLNETQTSVLTMVFKYCDDKKLLLLDLSDLRAVLQYLTGEGADELANYGGMSKSTVGVLLREIVQLEQQGVQKFFGEPEFDLNDLLVQRDGKGLISVLELNDVQDKPAFFSTFMMWMLARLYYTLPEVGDMDKPKLVYFFDEAHLLFEGASKAFRDQIQQIIRLIRSKGVGVFFITQSPKDIPADILGQLGNRVQHALRAFTPDDEAALRAAARTFPKTPFYDIESTLTTLGTGEALVTILTTSGAPTPPFATRMIPPASRMGPLTDGEFAQQIGASAQVKEYAQAIDNQSAREILAKQTAGSQTAAGETATQEPDTAEKNKPKAKEAPGVAEQIFKSPVLRQMAGTATRELTRGLMGALLGGGTTTRSRSRRR